MLQPVLHSHADLISLSASQNGLMDSMEAHRKAVGKRIADLREGKKLSQPELAFAAGIAQPSLWSIEKGKTVEVTARTFISICRALGTTWEFLWDGSVGLPADAANESELVATYRQLPEAGRLALIQSARALSNALIANGSPKTLALNIPATSDTKVAEETPTHQLQEGDRLDVGSAIRTIGSFNAERVVTEAARRRSGGVQKPRNDRGDKSAPAPGRKRRGTGA